MTEPWPPIVWDAFSAVVKEAQTAPDAKAVYAKYGRAFQIMLSYGPFERALRGQPYSSRE